MTVVIAATVAAAVVLATLVLLRPGGGERGQAPPLLSGAVRDFTVNDPPPPAPEETFASAGKEARLSDFRGHVVLLNFWATWCAPCVAEMPALDRLQAELGGAKFAVVAVSEDRDPAAIPPFLAQHRLDHLVPYHDPRGALSAAAHLNALPTSLLIDQAGRVVAQVAGPVTWDAPEARALIRRYMVE